MGVMDMTRWENFYYGSVATVALVVLFGLYLASRAFVICRRVIR